MGYKTLQLNFPRMSSDTCLKIEYNFCHVSFYFRLASDRTSTHSALKVIYI